MENKNIKNMSLLELKALAFDFMIQVDQAQTNLKLIFEEIEKRNNPKDKTAE
jgi:hypothetical protein